MTYVLRKRLTEHCDDVMTFGVGRAEALGPSDEHTVVDSLLPVQRQPSSLSTWTTTYEHGYENWSHRSAGENVILRDNAP